mmetsp:Transcript_20690/g.39340  ORF Transcript_20690/g.39340 Transcript_20690/m.39340 type:complete len:338 (-) Transcript_20690:156-1169(-)
MTSMDSLLKQLKAKLSQDTTALAVIDKVSALHSKTLQEHAFEVSLYRKEAFRLQMDNNKLRRLVPPAVLAEEEAEKMNPTDDSSSSPTSSSSSSSQGVIPSLKDEPQMSRDSPTLPENPVASLPLSRGAEIASASKSHNRKSTTGIMNNNNKAPPSATHNKRHSEGSIVSITNRPKAKVSVGRVLQNGEMRLALQSVPLAPPLPPHYQGDLEEAMDEEAPSFPSIVNYPQPSGSATGDTMKCSMCGVDRPLNKTTSSSKDATFVIPKQNKGVCTSCDSKVWVVKSTNMQIKWCKGCKNFQNWAAFGHKGCATKCCACRKRSADTYAAQKGKKKAKLT